MRPVVASYGGGINSTAMLIGMQQRGEQVDLILFADTGSEKPETYAYVKRFSAWLASHGLPEIVTVQKTVKRQGRHHAPGPLTLESYCLDFGFMPSVAYGYKTCSMKFKAEPQAEYIEKWAPAWGAWLCGEPVSKLIGFDADERHRSLKQSDAGYRARKIPYWETPFPAKNLLKTHCPAGHLLEHPNLYLPYFEKKGFRICLLCRKARVNAYHRKHPRPPRGRKARERRERNNERA